MSWLSTGTTGNQQIIIALITLVGVVITAVGSIIVSKIAIMSRHAKSAARDSAVAVEEVKNSHKVNLRVEQDYRHAELMQTLKEHGERLADLSDDQRMIRGDIQRMADTDLTLAKSVMTVRTELLEVIQNTKGEPK